MKLTSQHADSVYIVALPLLTDALHLDLRILLPTALLLPVLALQALLADGAIGLEVWPGLRTSLTGPLRTARLLKTLHSFSL